MDYDKDVFYKYVLDVIEELNNRNIKYKSSYVNEFTKFCSERTYFYIPEHYPEHNDRYLRQCYYNLQEKADRGIISVEEWKLIHKNIYGLIEREE